MVTVIIPIHEINDESLELLKSAVFSVPDEVKDIIVATGEDGDWSGSLGREVKVVVNEKTDFASLVNAAVEHVETKWFSILEYDDTYTPTWYGNVVDYAEWKPEATMFMVFQDISNFDDKKYINIGNVEVWASSFSNDVGKLDNDCLQNYFDFYLTGSLISTDDYKEIGGLKPSIKITFWYEWLLRATSKSKDIYVIPKVCYNHYLGRKGSLVDMYRNGMDDKEREWWFELAKRECFYKDDRNKTYEPEASEES